jgi:hypothetical protein
MLLESRVWRTLRGIGFGAVQEHHTDPAGEDGARAILVTEASIDVEEICLSGESRVVAHSHAHASHFTHTTSTGFARGLSS